MNRLKLWLYMLVVLGAGVANVYLLTIEGAARALDELEGGLQRGVQAHRAGEQLLSSRAAAVTALAVTDPALVDALAAGPRAEPRKKAKAEPAVDAEAESRARHEAAETAARGAVEKAAATLSVELPAAAFWAVANPEWLARNQGAEEGPQKEAVAFLREAAGGKPRRGYARVNDGLWFGVAMPAGQGAAMVLFVPVDAAWAGELKAASGCDVTIDAGTPQLITTARPEAARAIADAARASPGRTVGIGAIGRVQLTSPIRIQAPLLFIKAHATRAQALELPGLPRAHVVVSLPALVAYSPIAHYQWVALEVLAGLMLVGLLLGVLLKTEVLPQVPASLVAAAAKIERGDFAARAPEFLGALGTLSAALNKAAEVAQVAQAPAPHVDPFAAPPPAPEPHFDFSSPPPPAAAPAQARASAPAAPPAPPPEAQETTQRLDGGPERPPARAAPAPAGNAFASDTFTARPVPRPPPAAAPGGTAVGMPAMTSAGLTAATMPAVGAPSAAPGGPEDDEDAHWRAIHAEFLETRSRCGESIDSLGFDRFRPKLQKNKEALMQKYGCRAVRFSVYVKDGKAALKATPVK